MTNSIQYRRAYNSVPFQVIQLDLLKKFYSKQIFPYAGTKLIVADALILPTNDGDVPKIYFNSLQSRPLRLAPNSIFTLDFERFFIDSTPFTTTHSSYFPESYSIKPITNLIVCTEKDVHFNYFKFKKEAEIYFPSFTETNIEVLDLNFPIPFGTKQVQILLNFENSGDLPPNFIRMYNRESSPFPAHVIAENFTTDDHEFIFDPYGYRLLQIYFDSVTSPDYSIEASIKFLT